MLGSDMLSAMHGMQFMEWARPVCEQLVAWGYFADYIDPCSGLPVRLLVALHK